MRVNSCENNNLHVSIRRRVIIPSEQVYGDGMNHGKTVRQQQKYTVKQFAQESPAEDACLEHVKEERKPAGNLLCVRDGETASYGQC